MTEVEGVARAGSFELVAVGNAFHRLPRDTVARHALRFRAERPDATILEEAGFEPIGSYRFPTDHAWTPESLVGFTYSTSFLPQTVLGDEADRFAADLRRELHPHERDGVLRERIDFAYEVARRPT